MSKATPTHFRASFSILRLWDDGNWQDAIKAYFKKEMIVTPAMKAGLALHKEWEQHIKENLALPPCFAGKDPKPMEYPDCELKLTAEVEDWLTFSGVIDCLEQPIIHEFKSGATELSVWMRTMQAPCYGFLAEANGKVVNQAHIHHYNQYTKRSSMGIIWLTPELKEKAREWIVTNASEMHNYIIENNLWATLGSQEAA